MVGEVFCHVICAVLDRYRLPLTFHYLLDPFGGNDSHMGAENVRNIGNDRLTAWEVVGMSWSTSVATRLGWREVNL